MKAIYYSIDKNSLVGKFSARRIFNEIKRKERDVMWYVRDGDITTIFLYVQPGAKNTEITGLYDGDLKIRLNAPPVDGQANARLQKYLAQRFDVSLRQIRLIRGEKARRKVFEITGSSVEPESLV